MIRLMGLCFLAAAMTMVLRQMNMAAAGLLCTAFGVLVLGMMLPDIQEYVRQQILCKQRESEQTVESHENGMDRYFL